MSVLLATALRVGLMILNLYNGQQNMTVNKMFCSKSYKMREINLDVDAFSQSASESPGDTYA